MALASMALPIGMPRNDQRKKRPNIVQAAPLTACPRFWSRQRAPARPQRRCAAPMMTAIRKIPKQA